MIKTYQNTETGFSQRTSHTLAKISFAACISIALTGCGGGSGDTSESTTPEALSAYSDTLIDLPADTIQKIGEVFHYNFSSPALTQLGWPSIVSISAYFTEYENPMSAAYLDWTYFTGGVDECTINIADSSIDYQLQTEVDPELVEFRATSESISAGEVLSITTPTGSWPDLVLVRETYGYDVNEFEYLGYEFQTNISELGALPAGSTINIPGDQFPAFENRLFPSAPMVTNAQTSNLIDDHLTADSTITWDVAANLAPESITVIGMSSSSSDPETGAELLIDVFCKVSDDGEFSFPANVQQALTDYNFSDEGAYVSRMAVTTEVQGDSALVIGNISMQFLR